MIEISDLGEKTFYDIVKKKKNKLNYYKDLIKIIIKLQKIKIKKIYNLGKYKLKLQRYSLKIFIKSQIYFLIGILNINFKNSKNNKIKKILKKELNEFIKNFILKIILLFTEIFMHQIL